MFVAVLKGDSVHLQVRTGETRRLVMFLQQYGSLITGILLILVSLAGSYMIWHAPRNYGSPRWPQLAFCVGVILKGVTACLEFGHHSTEAGILNLFATGILWFAFGAVGTQWFHENVQMRRPIQR